METTVESTDEHTVKLTIEVPPEEFAKDLDKTYRAIAREVKFPGFRPGKAPKTIIDAQVGQDVVLDEFVHAAVPSYFRTAVTDEDLAPIGDPEVDVEQLELGKPFIFTATVEVRPRLELTEDDYKGVTVEKPATAATDEEVDQYVERLRRQFAELEPVGRPVKEGDFVTANVTVTRNGQQLDQLTREDYLYGRVGPVRSHDGREARRHETRRHPPVRGRARARTGRRGAGGSRRVPRDGQRGEGARAARRGRHVREDRVGVRFVAGAPRRPPRRSPKRRSASPSAWSGPRAPGRDRPGRRRAAGFADRGRDLAPHASRGGSGEPVRPHARSDARRSRDRNRGPPRGGQSRARAARQ